jgi:hypothetical protein
MSKSARLMYSPMRQMHVHRENDIVPVCTIRNATSDYSQKQMCGYN